MDANGTSRHGVDGFRVGRDRQGIGQDVGRFAETVEASPTMPHHGDESKFRFCIFEKRDLFSGAVFDFQSPHSEVQTTVSYLRSKFEILLRRPCEDASKSPGQMLLMGFNGLFEKLQVEGSQLTTTLCALNTPSLWKKVDQLREANMLTVSVIFFTFFPSSFKFASTVTYFSYRFARRSC